MKNKFKVTISVIIIFIGICLTTSTYFNTKKNEVFDDMNRLYYEQIVSLDDDIIENNEITDEALELDNNTNNKEITTPVIIDYSKYYIGYIKISKIGLERGFFSKDSKYNNVNRSIFVHPSSNYPDEKNGNLILASHSGTSSISYFKNLYQLNLDDDIYISYNNKEYHYQIKKIYTTIKDGTVSIRRNYDKNTLTLITCTKNDKTTQTIYICELIEE